MNSFSSSSTLLKATATATVAAATSIIELDQQKQENLLTTTTPLSSSFSSSSFSTLFLALLLGTIFILFSFLSNLFSSSPIMVSPAIKSQTEAYISGAKLFIASKSYCPYCRSTKSLLFNQLGVKQGNKGTSSTGGKDDDVIVDDVVVLELDRIPNGPEIQQALLEITGQRTVPNIFINKKHIGGNSDLQALYSSGKLEELLKEAGLL